MVQAWRGRHGNTATSRQNGALPAGQITVCSHLLSFVLSYRVSVPFSQQLPFLLFADALGRPRATLTEKYRIPRRTLNNFQKIGGGCASTLCFDKAHCSRAKQKQPCYAHLAEPVLGAQCFSARRTPQLHRARRQP